MSHQTVFAGKTFTTNLGEVELSPRVLFGLFQQDVSLTFIPDHLTEARIGISSIITADEAKAFTQQDAEEYGQGVMNFLATPTLEATA